MFDNKESFTMCLFEIERGDERLIQRNDFILNDLPKKLSIFFDKW